MSLTIYEYESQRIITTNDEAGRTFASQVLTGDHADLGAAKPTGIVVVDLNAGQQHHFELFGWTYLI